MSTRIPRKYTVRAHGQKLVLAKKRRERPEHVFMKAFLWALYLPDYPDATVEVGIGHRYKPDVVSLDRWGEPRFWGEAGRVGREKIERLARRHRDTHFAMAKWDTDLQPFETLVRGAMEGVRRTAPFDLIRIPGDAAERFIDESGDIRLGFDQLDWIRVGP